MTAYQLLGLNKAFVLGLEEMGTQHPTYAQTQFIPAVSRYDTDIIAVVKGKTPHEEAYGLPLLDQIDPAPRQYRRRNARRSPFRRRHAGKRQQRHGRQGPPGAASVRPAPETPNPSKAAATASR
jgi:hypothetical protein